jgi:uncharacterized protein (TIGR03067 family)
MKLFGTLIACAIIAAPVLAADKDFDASKFEGKWKFTEGWKFGTKSAAESLAGEVTITKDTITIKGGDMTHVMAYKLDTKATPVAVTLTGKEGPSKDFVSEGIIEVKDDEIKLCYAMPMEKRPTKFESPKDSKILYFTMKKVK